ncbi:hypothetical protein SARC_10745 [Sphaeroforma arctica JP610]|uniref:Uncharacterized protein n=1 Tax=Sphaeroforma arctica JP610 TaxID=667725 RepID=A0A0L0FJ23_9EUKA|nr:hypothetical protein SARC_10745 [Sphaeroforma arctica JP610]KNC76777.1 hypothetical protein SARC_10745 [Sphaeroforma arctica JP610]|eukprot:XP_014150679.1 hypothetical protein SARC_10745 [Sphaeroforma arctica JP610]
MKRAVVVYSERIRGPEWMNVFEEEINVSEHSLFVGKSGVEAETGSCIKHIDEGEIVARCDMVVERAEDSDDGENQGWLADRGHGMAGICSGRVLDEERLALNMCHKYGLPRCCRAQKGDHDEGTVGFSVGSDDVFYEETNVVEFQK